MRFILFVRFTYLSWHFILLLDPRIRIDGHYPSFTMPELAAN